jgi:hypothetical protein
MRQRREGGQGGGRSWPGQGWPVWQRPGQGTRQAEVTGVLVQQAKAGCS